MKKIIIAGGTGYLGKLLTNHFIKNNCTVIIITRGKSKNEKRLIHINWNDNWQKELETTDTIINLTGKSINCLFTKKNKELLISSRLEATQKINQAIVNCKNPPTLFINASGISIYKSSYKTDYSEYNEVFGSDFLSILSQKWEKEFYKTKTEKTRKVAIRISPVLGKNSKTIKTLLPVVKLGLGGKQGNGKQLFPWIHEHDFVHSINYIIKNESLTKSVNLITPNAITNTQFMQHFRESLHVKIGLPTLAFSLHLGKYFTKVEPEIILTSLYAKPKKLIDSGFTFKFDTMAKAFNEIFK